MIQCIYLRKYNIQFIKRKKKSKILVMGLSFKENVPDIRNSKSFDLISYLKKRNFKVDCYDNNVDNNQVKKNL